MGSKYDSVQTRSGDLGTAQETENESRDCQVEVRGRRADGGAQQAARRCGYFCGKRRCTIRRLRRACGKGAKSVTHRKNKVLLKSMGLRGQAGFLIVKQQ